MPVCTKDAHVFLFGPFGPCQCLKFLSAPNKPLDAPPDLPDPPDRERDTPRKTGALTSSILALCAEPTTTKHVAVTLQKSPKSIGLMLNYLRRHGRVRVHHREGRIAFYSRVTAEIPDAHTSL